MKLALVKPFLWLMCIVVTLSCGPQEEVLPEWIVPPPGPRAAYIHAFSNTSLENAALYKQWQLTADLALEDTLTVETPHDEILYFDAAKPNAVGYRVQLEQGQELHFVKDVKPQGVHIFVELFRPSADSSSEFELLGELEIDSDTFNYEAFRSGMYLIRIQPEMLVDCAVGVKIESRPVYEFPVDGKSNNAIGSFFGDPRDGGRREHKGVDIFARRGTPVLAISNGIVRRVREGGLGGKTVWVRDPERSINQYYAHLDTQMVRTGQHVKMGDTIGLVGNTGNARTTPSHLHFGIYVRSQGAVDPQPYISRTKSIHTALNASIEKSQMRRTKSYATKVYAGPQRRATVIQSLAPHQFFKIISESREYYRVSMPGGLQGYLRKQDTEAFNGPINRLAPESNIMLWKDYAHQLIPVVSVPQGEYVSVLASAGSAIFAEYRSDDLTYQGWLH